MRLETKYVIFLLTIFSCSEPELQLDNEYDPGNPDFEAPETTIQYVDQVISENEIEIFWDGNQVDMEFQTRLDDGDWSDWSNRKSETFSYLDEGIHEILVKGKYASGTVEDYPDTVSFEVDAISNNSLRIHPLQTTVVESEVFFVDIMAEEINALAGAGIILNFYSNDLTLVDVKKGNFFSDDSDNIILFINENESAGITNLQIDIATIDDSQFADGTGVMVVLEFEALSAGTTTIEFDGDYTTLRNANNGEININELVNGFVKIF